MEKSFERLISRFNRAKEAVSELEEISKNLTKLKYKEDKLIKTTQCTKLWKNTVKALREKTLPYR